MTIAEPPTMEEELPPQPPRGTRVTALGKLVILMLVLLILVGGFGVYVLKATTGSANGREVAVVIEPGASASSIARTLKDAGVIRNAWVFRLYARIKGLSRNLKPGEYRLRANMAFADVLRLLEKGPTIEFTRVTIPEGKTVREIADILAKAGIPRAEFLKEATSGRHRTDILPKGSKNLEGALFPKTYDFKKGTTASQAVDLLLGQFEKETETVDWSAAQKFGMTRYQILIIASMIEREARVPQDRAKIARVIYNRLARPMRLQIDATVQYAIFLKTGSYKNPLLTSDYQFSSSYNTYLIDGLPPAPISNPGLASIDAALHPAEGKWLYYVLINDKGEHAFAETYEEFQRLKNSR
jgi:peptidoglycan lytic transglycosylase G